MKIVNEYFQGMVHLNERRLDYCMYCMSTATLDCGILQSIVFCVCV